tara:strand:- start:14039 stop:14572 length:534 start_codon:yes stop_codon:yes gene_type:complete
MATNLQFINKTEITSGSQNVNVDNVFSDQYKVYVVQLIGVVMSTDVSNDIEGIRFIDNSGSVVTGNEYAYASLAMYAGGSFGEVQSTSDGKIRLFSITDQVSQGQTGGTLYIFNPNDSSSYTFLTTQGYGFNSSDNLGGNKGIGVHKSAETIRGFQFHESNTARKFGGGTIVTYGVK